MDFSRHYFNPRSSCEERRTRFSTRSTTRPFQSTLLMRGATLPPTRSLRAPLNFNPRSSCEERQSGGRLQRISRHFNPRSSCEERHLGGLNKRIHILFQSTLLMRGATTQGAAERRPCDISIHAPHARSDMDSKATKPYPQISIHAPHARSDHASHNLQCQANDFNPRSSCEERRE